MTKMTQAALPLWINGRQQAAQSGRVADVCNPATGEVVRQVPLASAKDVDAAVAELSKGDGADLVCEMSGAPSALHTAFRLVRYGGMLDVYRAMGAEIVEVYWPPRADYLKKAGVKGIPAAFPEPAFPVAPTVRPGVVGDLFDIQFTELQPGANSRLIKRNGPAAGHRSDPDWKPPEESAETELEGERDLAEDEDDALPSGALPRRTIDVEDPLDLPFPADEDTGAPGAAEVGRPSARARTPRSCSSIPSPSRPRTCHAPCTPSRTWVGRRRRRSRSTRTAARYSASACRRRAAITTRR